MEDVTDLMSVVEQMILQPAAITWIDMSFNKLHKIDPVSAECISDSYTCTCFR